LVQSHPIIARRLRGRRIYRARWRWNHFVIVLIVQARIGNGVVIHSVGPCTLTRFPECGDPTDSNGRAFLDSVFLVRSQSSDTFLQTVLVGSPLSFVLRPHFGERLTPGQKNTDHEAHHGARGYRMYPGYAPWMRNHDAKIPAIDARMTACREWPKPS
jgi:hypothetical protein